MQKIFFSSKKIKNTPSAHLHTHFAFAASSPWSASPSSPSAPAASSPAYPPSAATSSSCPSRRGSCRPSFPSFTFPSTPGRSSARCSPQPSGMCHGFFLRHNTVAFCLLFDSVLSLLLASSAPSNSWRQYDMDESFGRFRQLIIYQGNWPFTCRKDISIISPISTDWEWLYNGVANCPSVNIEQDMLAYICVYCL